MQGSITYRPREGGGSIFTASIVLSLATSGDVVQVEHRKKLKLNDAELIPNSKSNSTKPVAINDEPSSATILIVEDNRTNMHIAAAYCKKLGYQVIQAENGLCALEQLDAHYVDAIIMDCQMPVMDGFEATQKIRASNSAYSELPIIAVTANTSSKDYQRCMEVGMNDYLAKPITKNMLAEKLEFWLNQSGQTQTHKHQVKRV